MSQGLLMKKKEQQQHQFLLQQQQSSFPSPITPNSTYDKKLFSSPSSSSSSSCRYDSGVSSGSSAAAEVSSNASYSSPSSSSASTPAPQANSQRSSAYSQYPFGDVYGSSGNFLSSSYASAALTSHHELSRSCSALPSPTIYPPTPPPSSTPWLHHPAWFGSLETAAVAGYMKTPKNNPFEN